MCSVHTHDLFACRDLEVLPRALAWLVVPVLVHNVVACLIKNSEAVNVASHLVVLVDVNISDAVVWRNTELLDCALLLALGYTDTHELALDPAREVQFKLV